MKLLIGLIGETKRSWNFYGSLSLKHSDTDYTGSGYLVKLNSKMSVLTVRKLDKVVSIALKEMKVRNEEITFIFLIVDFVLVYFAFCISLWFDYITV